ncbi:hypothetical protein HPB48_009574 [Haemaphysalis longicornis]|uniref:Uncharacterized protein n=1 Tax=Haemaphysalis longicornis TaxID=44386 RepID=A0A9J6FAQ3_HAELO|nr:hypothetical protein HPB48_009574 [Haemaphysalis longicornis]
MASHDLNSYSALEMDVGDPTEDIDNITGENNTVFITPMTKKAKRQASRSHTPPDAAMPAGSAASSTDASTSSSQLTTGNQHKDVEVPTTSKANHKTSGMPTQRTRLPITVIFRLKEPVNLRKIGLIHAHRAIERHVKTLPINYAF